MKRLPALSAGLLLLLSLPAAHAASLYDMVKKSMDMELRSEDVEEEVATFVEKLATEKEWDITKDEVASIVRGSTDVCSKHEKLNGFGCAEVLKQIREMVSYENQVRLAGRHMQAIATEYELPISEIPRKTGTLSADLTGVVNLWKAGSNDGVQAAPKTIPSITIEDDDEKDKVKQLLQTLNDKLNELDPEERIGAVWRYQYGERLVRGKRTPDYAAPAPEQDNCEKTERRFLCKRWEEVENALDAVWTELLRAYGDKKDTPPVYYIALPDELLQELPENTILWARMDRDARHPQGDVGLQWEFPVEPVLPALIREGDNKPILGGTYPPEPPQRKEENTKKRLEDERLGRNTDLGSGICSMAFAAKGYLCRAVSVESPAECPEPDSADKDAIVLVSCTFQGYQKKTLAGPDVCSELTWNTTTQPETASGQSSSSSSYNPSCGCSYTVTCQSDCDGGLGGATYPKDANGNIRVCIDTSPYIQTPQDLLEHEMVHVRQNCAKPASDAENTKESCCSAEYDAYLVNCQAADARGQLAPLGLSVSRCASMLSNRSCQKFGGNACTTATNDEQDALTKALKTTSDGKCPVESGKKQEINMCPCTPETLSKYGNTIGNNLCFIGQCVEQSLDTHRVTPGRTPAGVQDGAFPNDDALAGSPLGNFLTAPASGQPVLPPYRPLQPIREFEAALCALVGLPTTVPSALCAIAAGENGAGLTTDPLTSVLNMAQNRAEEQLSLADFSTLAQSVGTRIGTDLYARNMRMMSKSLAEILGTATSLLNEVKSIDFPTEMCPLGPASPSEPAPE